MASRWLCVLLLVGCSSDPETVPTPVDSSAVDTAADTATPEVAFDSAVPDASSDVAAETAADTAPEPPMCSVGAPCNDTQPCVGSLICYGFGATGFCAPPEPQCGGFTMKMCTGGRACLRASGSSLGFCADAAEMKCICDKPDAGKVDGC